MAADFEESDGLVCPAAVVPPGSADDVEEGGGDVDGEGKTLFEREKLGINGAIGVGRVGVGAEGKEVLQRCEFGYVVLIGGFCWVEQDLRVACTYMFRSANKP